jgi:hypothetical protein
MPPIFGIDVERKTQRLQELAPTSGEVVEASFDEAIYDNPFTRAGSAYIANFVGDEKKRFSKEEIKERAEQFGVELKNIPEDGYTPQAANYLLDRQRLRKGRQDILNNAQGGFGEGAASVAAQFVGSALDPIGLPLNFIPVIAPAKYAALVKGAAGIAGRTGVRAGVGAAEGLAGAAVGEVLNYPLAQEIGDDYTTADSLGKVAFGAVLGAGLHSGAGAVSDFFKGVPFKKGAKPSEPSAPPGSGAPAKIEAPKKADLPDISDVPAAAKGAPAVMDRLGLETKEAAMNIAIRQLSEGKTVDVMPAIEAQILKEKLALENTKLELKAEAEAGMLSPDSYNIRDIETLEFKLNGRVAPEDLTVTKSFEPESLGKEVTPEQKSFELKKFLQEKPPTDKAFVFFDGRKHEVLTATDNLVALKDSGETIQVRTYDQLAADAKLKAELGTPKDPDVISQELARMTPDPKDIQARTREKIAEAPNSVFLEPELTAKQQQFLDEAPVLETLDDYRASIVSDKAELEALAKTQGIENVDNLPGVKEALDLEKKAADYEKAMKAAASCGVRKGTP